MAYMFRKRRVRGRISPWMKEVVRAAKRARELVLIPNEQINQDAVAEELNLIEDLASRRIGDAVRTIRTKRGSRHLRVSC